MARTDALASPAMAAPSPRAVLELLKPITWFPPMWAFGCGAVSAGVSASGHWPLILGGIALSGPFVCATSQAVNDWFDRHVDAINEPGRPIPSGRLPGRTGLYVALAWTGLSLALALLLGTWAFAAAVFGLALAWAYSAPPVRLKQNGWWGNAACGLCYEGLPWLTAAAILSGARPGWHIIAVALLYAAGAHGIMTLNDFKSIEGDRRTGVNSLPVLMGAEHAGRLACVVMAGPQAIVVTLLAVWGFALYAAAIALSLGVQLALMARLLRRPRELAPWYNATGVSLYVLGMLVSAFALQQAGVAAP